MRQITVHNREITIDNKTMKTTWTQELVNDLKKFHDIDFKDIIVDELNCECSLTEEEKANTLSVIKAQL